MANYIHPKFKENLLQFTSGYNLSTGNVKAVLLDIDQMSSTITAATNATPTVLTVTGHGLTTGDYVNITGALGNTAINGFWKVTVVDANTFTLINPLTNASVAGTGTYTSGGKLMKMSAYQYLGDIPSAARISTTANLTGKSFTNGVFKASNSLFSLVTGAVSEAVALYIDSGTASTSPVVCFIDTNITGAPITPNGGDINLNFDATNGVFAL